MPAFFVPFTTPREGDTAYEDLARMAGVAAVPPEEERVFSIVFIQDGDVWSAKVGERLYGRRSYQSTFFGKPGPTSSRPAMQRWCSQFFLARRTSL